MEIQTICSASFTVYLGEGDLEALHITPTKMTEKDTEDVLHLALRSLGKKPCRQVQTEFFPGKHELLLFIRINTGNVAFFGFDEFEDVCSAVAGCAEPLPSSLAFLDGRYILSVYPWDSAELPSSLIEFGEGLKHPPEYELFLDEHAKKLISNDAIAVLWDYFFDKRA
ncbi:MAG: adaptor protein MecA [Oscillospiraceae bacterium]